MDEDDEDRKKTIELMVRNYYAQVRIVEKLRQSKYGRDGDMTLVKYLQGIGISLEEIEYAVDYSQTIPIDKKTIFPEE